MENIFFSTTLFLSLKAERFIYNLFFSTCVKVALMPLKIPIPINHFEVVNIPMDKQVTDVAIFTFSFYL